MLMLYCVVALAVFFAIWFLLKRKCCSCGSRFTLTSHKRSVSERGDREETRVTRCFRCGCREQVHQILQRAGFRQSNTGEASDPPEQPFTIRK